MKSIMRRNILFKESGFSLIELILSMAIGLIILAGVMSLFNGQRKVYSIQDQISEMDQNVRFAMDFIVSRVRMMGYDPSASNNFGLTDTAFANTATSIDDNITLSFTKDTGDPPGGPSPVNGILDINVNERLIFYLNGTNLMLDNLDGSGNRVNGGTILASNIILFNIVYTYRDGTNSIGGPGADGIVGTADDVIALPNDASANGLNDVKSITITIRGRTSGSDPNYTNPVDASGFRTTTLLSTVSPRNLDSVL